MADEPVVYAVDDDPAVCDALATLIRSVGLAVETYPSAADFLEAYEPGRPSCLVLDVRLPGMSGLELQNELDKRGLRIPVIIITAHGDMPIAVRAMRAGALDCLPKPFNDQALLDRIHEAIAADARVRRDEARRAELAKRIGLLSEREHEVMERIVQGKTSQVVAKELGVSKKTIDAHRAKVMEKMRADSLAALVQFVVEAREGTAAGGPAR